MKKLKYVKDKKGNVWRWIQTKDLLELKKINGKTKVKELKGEKRR